MHHNVTPPPQRQLRFARSRKFGTPAVIPEITCREIVAMSPSLEIIHHVGGRSLARSNGLELSIPAIRCLHIRHYTRRCIHWVAVFVQCDSCRPKGIVGARLACFIHTWLGFTVLFVLKRKLRSILGTRTIAFRSRTKFSYLIPPLLIPR